MPDRTGLLPLHGMGLELLCSVLWARCITAERENELECCASEIGVRTIALVHMRARGESER